MTDEGQEFLFETGAVTHRGVVRDHNEDSFVALPDIGIWAVADGMGGHQAGDVASRMIVEEVSSVGIAVSAQDQRARFMERIKRANQRILAHTSERQLATVGSTLAAMLVYGNALSCIWAGDSRVYLLRKGILTRLTTDHSEVARLVSTGEMTEEEARNSPARNVITRAIGIQLQPQPETATGMAEPHDVLLLCSDGLTEHSSDDDLRQILLSTEPAQSLADRLIATTLERGARDNVTAIVVRCLPMPGKDTIEE